MKFLLEMVRRSISFSVFNVKAEDSLLNNIAFSSRFFPKPFRLLLLRLYLKIVSSSTDFFLFVLPPVLICVCTKRGIVFENSVVHRTSPRCYLKDENNFCLFFSLFAFIIPHIFRLSILFSKKV